MDTTGLPLPSSNGPDTPDAASHGRVVVADDDVMLRKGLVRLLTRYGFEVVGQAGDATRLLELVREHQPDLAIIDTRMPPTCTTEGLQAARTIREQLPSVGILVLSAYVEVEQALHLMAGGAGIGYLLKSGVTDVADFIDALDRIVNGGTVVDSTLVSELVTAYRRDDPLAGLSPEERQVLTLMAEGRSDADIAQRLWLSEQTVEKHVRDISTRLCLPVTETDHRRALTVLALLGG